MSYIIFFTLVIRHICYVWHTWQLRSKNDYHTRVINRLNGKCMTDWLVRYVRPKRNFISLKHNYPLFCINLVSAATADINVLLVSISSDQSINYHEMSYIWLPWWVDCDWSKFVAGCVHSVVWSFLVFYDYFCIALIWLLSMRVKCHISVKYDGKIIINSMSAVSIHCIYISQCMHEAVTSPFQSTAIYIPVNALTLNVADWSKLLTPHIARVSIRLSLLPRGAFNLVTSLFN